ncbi:MAG: (2Fe-2S)-binding protein [Thaumarchaeota archaeon 13_1_40CM_4_38_7]|nr:MAG: (2Fe-2S)-binding protein [Thaumarchaeota archaeon 13_1_40CM_4_38_7]
MSEQGAIDKNSLTRRDFLKLLGAAGLGLAFAPFVDWGKYMPNPQTVTLTKQAVILSDGTRANVNTFPINHQEVITYPSTGDSVLDKEAFKQWNLIRLPADLGGSVNDVTAFRVYSIICLHLWCVWKYVPVGEVAGNDKGQCPCHGSMYDPLSGKAIAGPASVQAPPSNILPTLNLEADNHGNLSIKPATWNVYKNGVIGYGRFVAT